MIWSRVSHSMLTCIATSQMQPVYSHKVVTPRLAPQCGPMNSMVMLDTSPYVLHSGHVLARCFNPSASLQHHGLHGWLALLQVDLKTSNGSTALHNAANCGHAAVVKQLLQAGAGVGQCALTGANALFNAATAGQSLLSWLFLPACCCGITDSLCDQANSMDLATPFSSRFSQQQRVSIPKDKALFALWSRVAARVCNQNIATRTLQPETCSLDIVYPCSLALLHFPSSSRTTIGLLPTSIGMTAGYGQCRAYRVCGGATGGRQPGGRCHNVRLDCTAQRCQQWPS